MRDRGSRNGISIKAYAGTAGVMLAMNVTDHKRPGLLGFAVEREGPWDQHRWLRGLLRFPGQGDDGPVTPVESKIAPLQKFRWADYSVYPGERYTYRVHGVYGTKDQLRYKEGGEATVVTERLDSGVHRVIFNRAAAASQAYARRFKNANPDLPENLAAREWLSRGLHEKLLAFLGRANGPRWAIDLAIYEIELPEVVEALREARRLGAKVRVVYHAKKNDHQTEMNEDTLRPLAAAAKVGRKTSSIFHQKFAVLSVLADDGSRVPVSVLSGSTNFTPNGVYRQANVVHIVEDPSIAGQYLALFEQLFGGENTRNTKRFINENNPIVQEPRGAVFSPRSGLTDLEEVKQILQNVQGEMMFCTAFKLHDMVTAAVHPAAPDNVIRYGLQNSRSTITGTHRHGTFIVPTFLKDGLENFLKESTAGQRGNILIHLKCMLCDFTSDDPIIITGSNNFSKAGSSKNDENMLILRGETAVADTYLCEMLRFYDHYRFRFNIRKQQQLGQTVSLGLAEDDRWTNPYFEPAKK